MKYWITIILIYTLSITKAQSLNDSLLLELEHQFWLAKNDSVKFNALLNKADVLYTSGNVKAAANELYRSQEFAKTYYQQTVINYKKMLFEFVLKQYAFVHQTQLTPQAATSINKLQEYELMYLFSLNETQYWERCKDSLLKLCSNCSTTLKDSITALPVVYDYLSPEKAELLSAFLPGLGQTYSTYPLKGFTSLVLNSGFIYITTYAILNSYYVTAVVYGIFPLLKFYNGGKRLSGKLANNKNEIRKQALQEHYKKVIKRVVLKK